MDPHQLLDENVTENEDPSEGAIPCYLQSVNQELNQPGAFNEEGGSRNPQPLEPDAAQNSKSSSRMKQTKTNPQTDGNGGVRAKKAGVEVPAVRIPDAELLESCYALDPLLLGIRENEKIIEKAKAEIERLEDAAQNSKSGKRLKQAETKTNLQTDGDGGVRAKKARVEDPAVGIPDAELLESCATLDPILLGIRENEKIIEKAKAEIEKLQGKTLKVMRTLIMKNRQMMSI